MTDDFTPWLRARLDAREALARAAATEYPGGSGLHWEARNGSVTPTNPVDSNPVADAAGWGSLGDATAAHIADNDPARVLAAVAATRRRVDLHQPVTLRKGGGADYFVTARVCMTCGGSDASFNDGTPAMRAAAYPCPTLRLEALPYATHPGYRPEWSTQ
ncbi:DUF6221 family protein [Micromonospora haikouensis]|uniref:DUF6221 family protein n=1 Tax=Micromonospora haikouensis TaxID=686309 RepID=UPI0034125228